MKSHPPRRLPGLAVIAVTVTLLLAGCAGPLPERGPGTKVAASFYPLEYVSQRVAGDHAEVVNLTSPGFEPHDAELTVRQTADVAGADLVVYEKGLQPAVDAAVEQNGPERVIDVTDVVDLEPLGAHEAQEEHGSDSNVDPHFWLDPLRMVKVADAVRRQLSELDPEHAADYSRNFDALREDLEKVDQAYRQGLADCDRHTVVVSHDAFGYLGKYGLHFESVSGLSPEAEPSPAHLAELAKLIREEHITTVFSEALASPAMADTLARDLGLKTAVLDPIEGLSNATAHEDYLSLMRANLEALRAANGCP
ncbi:MAG TPA: metal ABC transporter substrate-binding protein [Nocardioidaceae bacterium]|nr:metal ABC transporter substrate-binding protein [Nocardioidaceae bacterium]